MKDAEIDRKFELLYQKIHELETRLASVEQQAKATDKFLSEKLRELNPRNR